MKPGLGSLRFFALLAIIFMTIKDIYPQTLISEMQY